MLQRVLVDDRSMSEGPWPTVVSHHNCLPLILSARFVEDVLLSIDGEDTIFHDALPTTMR